MPFDTWLEQLKLSTHGFNIQNVTHFGSKPSIQIAHEFASGLGLQVTPLSTSYVYHLWKEDTILLK